MLEDVTPPDESRSKDERTLTVVSVPLTRFNPLNCAAPTTDVIWSRSAEISVWIFVRSTLDSCAATILPLMSVNRSVTVSEALRATATVELPKFRLSEIALKPFTSDSITLEIDQTAELSFAEAIVLPVEMADCVCARSELMDLRV